MQPHDDEYGKGFKFNLNIQDSTVTASRDTNIHVSQYQSPPKDAMEILRKHVAFGALFDSKERFDPPKCHPDTRTAVLDSINRWAQNQDSATKPIMWLRGAAGAGKSAIAQTSAERWEELKILAASFFFSRTGIGRNESSRLIPTLAYQLSLSIPSTWPHMKAVLLRDVGLFERSLKTQLTELIIRPLTAVASQENIGCNVVIIDGLDECCVDLPGQKYEAQQRDILDAITAYSIQTNCPLRFLITSRPERQIRASFARLPLITWSRTIILDDTQNPTADIELFLKCSFDEIRYNHPYLDSSWPSERTISTLLQKSSGHFIYASTAVRYLQRPRQDPRAALEAILNVETITSAEDSPFTELDALYMFIMHLVSRESLPIVLNIFELMCYRSTSVLSILDKIYIGGNPLSPMTLERYLFLPSGSVRYTHLVDLYSILEIPPEGASPEAPVRFIHASFSEFLTNRSRSGPFYVTQDSSLAISSLWLKHLFVQSLHRDHGHKLGYMDNGFSIELLEAFLNDRVPPPQGFLEGVTALIGEDKEIFARYVRSIGLDHLGVERNQRWMEQFVLLETIQGNPQTGITIILPYLKKYGVHNFKTLLAGYEIREGEIVSSPHLYYGLKFGSNSSESVSDGELAGLPHDKEEEAGERISAPNPDRQTSSAGKCHTGRGSSESVNRVELARVQGDVEEEEPERLSAVNPNPKSRKGFNQRLHQLQQRLSTTLFRR